MDSRKILVLELQSNCNAECVYCAPHHLEDRGVRVMRTAMIANLIDEAYRLGYRELHPQMRGEPTLDPEGLRAAILEARRLGMVTAVYSNGTNPPPEIPDSLRWSLDWHTPELCAEIAPGLDFDRVVRNVRGWWQRHGHMTPYRRIIGRVTVCRENVVHVQDIMAFWRPYVHDVAQVLEFPLVREVAGFRVDPEAPCAAYDRQLVVLSDGRVVGCCSDHRATVVLGQYPDQSLAEILVGQPRAEFQRRMEAREWYPICKRCGLREAKP